MTGALCTGAEVTGTCMIEVSLILLTSRFEPRVVFFETDSPQVEDGSARFYQVWLKCRQGQVSLLFLGTHPKSHFVCPEDVSNTK